MAGECTTWLLNVNHPGWNCDSHYHGMHGLESISGLGTPETKEYPPRASHTSVLYRMSTRIEILASKSPSPDQKFCRMLELSIYVL